MGDARNIYPRLCWGCLGIIENAGVDHANLTYGGTCTSCHEANRDELPGLKAALNGYTERMNWIFDRDNLLMKTVLTTASQREQTYRQALEEVQRLLLEAFPIKDFDFTLLLLRVGESQAVISLALKPQESEQVK